VSGDFVRKELKYRCAYIGGTFDCLHRGHLAIFAAAKKRADTIVVSVNTDEFAARYKRRPLMPLADRFSVLSNLRIVDRVIVNSGDENSKVAILFSGADVIVHGSDWSGDGLMKQMDLTPEWLSERGIAMQILPYTEFTSTSQILAGYEARKVVQKELGTTGWWSVDDPGAGVVTIDPPVLTTTCLTVGKVVTP
jgi:cytidyltransferase-like protein